MQHREVLYKWMNGTCSVKHMSGITTITKLHINTTHLNDDSSFGRVTANHNTRTLTLCKTIYMISFYLLKKTRKVEFENEKKRAVTLKSGYFSMTATVNHLIHSGCLAESVTSEGSFAVELNLFIWFNPKIHNNTLIHIPCRKKEQGKSYSVNLK